MLLGQIRLLRFPVAGALVAATLVWTGSAFGAAINLPPPPIGDVDITTFNAALSYVYSPKCANSKGVIAACGGTYTITNAATWAATTGQLKITGTTMTLDTNGPGAGGLYNVTGTPSFSFTANYGFNSTGTALVLKIANDSPDDLVIKGTTTAPGFAGPTLLTAEIQDATTKGFASPFGYAGIKNAGTFEFLFNSLTGNVAAGANIAYMVASTTNFVHPLLPTSAPAGTTWDSKGINFWKNNFSATNVRVDTYVPVPPAMILFGSALAGIGALRRRKASSALAA